jgi:TonB-dependent receptor
MENSMNQTLNQDRNSGFKKKLIATAVASALLGGNHFVQAQTDGTIEEVVVTGIRASLQRSMDVKRESRGVVDAISAEDIGKFPDTNLAESLQRITGVSIDRSNGEGSKVTVRGLGPDFNLVTLNGRQLPGATIDATSASGSRSFDFSNIASESVSAIEVYKTGRADITPGGMGATINIVTPKPLKNDPRASIAVKGVMDQSTEDSEITPEISGIYSTNFADGMFGVAVTGSYQERQSTSASANIGTGWRSFQGTVVQDWSSPDTSGWGGIPLNDGNQQNPPTPEDIYSTPQSVNYGFSDIERKRTNAQLTLQFAPTDTFTATLDHTYSQNDVTENFSDIGGWFNFGGQSTIFSENGEGVVETPLLYSETHTFGGVPPGDVWHGGTGGHGGDLAMATGINSRYYENNSTGLNLEFSPIDPLTLTLDAHHSTAEARPDNDYGNSVGIAVSAYVRERTTVNVKGDMPVMILDVVNGVGGNTLRTEDLHVSGSYFRSSQMEHTIDQIQLGGKWEFNDQLSASAGIGLTQGDYESSFSNVQRDTWGGLGNHAGLPAEIFTTKSIQNYFSGSKGSTSAEEMDFLGGTSTAPWDTRFVADFEMLRTWAVDNVDPGDGPADCAGGGTWYCAAPPDVFDKIEEDSESFYAQVDYNTDTLNLNAGLRYESTEVTTPLSSYTYGPVRWVAGNEFTMDRFPGATPVVVTGKYDYLLPAVNAAWTVEENVVVRASFGQSLARPNWLDLRGTTFNQGLRIQSGTASTGNPELKPYKSDNFDFSAEWYYDDASYMSAGYFTKKVENFITNRVVLVEGPLENNPHPAHGPRFAAAVASGLQPTDTVGIRQYILDNFPDPETAYVDASGNIIIVGIPGEDDNANYDVTEVINGDQEVWIDGFELAVQHNFWESGFGVIANYTLVESSTEFDNMTLNDPQFAVTGVSDTANLVGFYDKNGLQVRIAYNWRDDFLASPASGTGNNPINVREYSQVDLNVSYDIIENLSIFLEALNVTEESGRTYGRDERQVLGWFEGAARYNIGARYTF